MNLFVGVGRLTKEPDVRWTQTGKCVTQFTLAINRQWSKNKEADFLPVVVWDKLAEICGEHLHKGNQVGIEGRVQVRSYEDNSNVKHYITEIIADKIEFLGSKPKDEPSGGAMTEQQKSIGQEVPPDEEIPF